MIYRCVHLELRCDQCGNGGSESEPIRGYGITIPELKAQALAAGWKRHKGEWTCAYCIANPGNRSIKVNQKARGYMFVR